MQLSQTSGVQHRLSGTSSNLRALIIAEAANPEWVSVPLEGWSHFLAISRNVNAHLVTHVRNSHAIKRVGLASDAYSIIDSERVSRRLYRLGSLLRGGAGKGWTTMMACEALSYCYFEYLVWKRFGPAIINGEFDVVHRVTPLSPTIPSLLAQKCRKVGVPFVLGPLNGGVPWPNAFDSERRMEKEWLSYVRGAYKLLPGFSATRKNAAAIVIGSKDTWNQISSRYRSKCIYIPENAIDPERFSLQRTRKATRPIQIVFVGRLVPYKGADMLLEAALPFIRCGELRIKIIGDGPQFESLRETITREGVSSDVELTGWIDHTSIQQHLITADLFVFPSIREFGGAVALEAMAVGLVPMVVRYGGLGELVTEETGFLIEMGNRESIISQLRALLQQVIQNPGMIEVKSVAARKRVLQNFTWDVKASLILEVYKWVLGQRSDRPSWDSAVG